MHRTSSNLLEPHHRRDSTVCRVHMSSGLFDCAEPSLSTFFAGCLCTSSGWFKRIEPPRTFYHIIAEIARCIEFFHISSGWFDCTEPSLSTLLQGKQGLQGAYSLVRGCSRASNPSRPTSSSGVESFVTCIRGGSTAHSTALSTARRMSTPRFPCKDVNLIELS